jgi:hypothetical protein
MATQIHYRPGEICPRSGQYVIHDSTGIERTVVRGEPFPPTPSKGQSYRLADPSSSAVEQYRVDEGEVLYKPGHKARFSGQYGIVGEDGILTDQERTVVRGEPFPPTPDEGQSYVLMDATQHTPPSPHHPMVAYAGAHLLNTKQRRELGQLVPVTVYVQDPEVARKRPAVGLQELELDWEPNLGDGPTSARFAVVDYDGDTGELWDPVRWDQASGRFLDPLNREVGRHTPNTRSFHQVNVWAVAQRVLDFYEDTWQGGLGRTIPWAFDGSRLILVPHAGLAENACYDRHSKSLQFYYRTRGETIDYSCLSHDIIAHEMGHAILDGIRPYYWEDSSLQTRAFHEFVADQTAILTALRNNDVRGELEKLTKGKIDLANFVADLGEVFGDQTKGRRYVRNALQDPKVTMADLDEGKSPHYCSQVLTGAMWDIMATMAAKYMKIDQESPKLALWHVIDGFRRIALRPLEFLPPVDVQFIDYARAVLRAHALSHPRDRHGYRDIMRKVFAERGLTELDKSTKSPSLSFKYQYDIEHVSRSRIDAYRFLDDHRRELCIPAQQDFYVADLYEASPVARGGRRLPRKIVIQYVWMEEVELEPRTGRRFRGRRIPLWCGGTLVFDALGNLLSWIRKPGTQEIRCADGSKSHRRCKLDSEMGHRRKQQLLEHIGGGLQRGWVKLVAEDESGQLDVERTPVVARQVGGVLRMEAVPHLRHRGEGWEE